MTAKDTAASVDVDELIRENERLKSNLKHFEDKFRRMEAFMNNAPFVIYMKNQERHYSFFNPVRERQIGLEPDDILWHTDLELAGNLWGIRAHEQDGKVLASNQAVEILESSPGSGGDAQNWLVVRFPFTGPDGEPCIGAVGLDIALHLAR